MARQTTAFRAMALMIMGLVFGMMESGAQKIKITAAANIKFNKKKEVYEIESFGNQYIKPTNVRKEK
jgi:hypothetical protein